MTTRLSLRQRLLVATAIAVALLGIAVPVDAEGLALSPEPTADLTCNDNGSSVLTIHWPIGEYGVWSVGDPLLGELGGPGAVYTAPTDETFVVPSGWTPTHSTVRLNQDTMGETSYNQFHLTVNGATCPFTTPVSASINCFTRNLATSIPAGHVTSITVYDQDGNIIYFRRYPRFSRTGQILDPVQIGPVVLNAPVSGSVTSVHVEVTVDNTVISTDLDTSCVPPAVEVSGVDGEVHQSTACDGTVTTDLTAGSIAIERTGGLDEAVTVELVYADLDGALAAGLPLTVHFDPGQAQVVVPVESGVAGSVQVTVVSGTGYAVGGTGYVVGTESSAVVRIPVVSVTDGCEVVPPDEPTPDDPPTDPTDPGAPASPVKPGSPSGPTGLHAPVTPVAPLDPAAAPPADVISGVAHLTG